MSARPLRRSEGVLVERLDDSLVIYDNQTKQAHALDAAASAVWAEADGRRNVAEVAQAAGLPEGVAVAALDQLAARGLLVTEPGVSRRAMLKHSAVVGGAVAVGAALIETVAIPAAAAHASPHVNI